MFNFINTHLSLYYKLGFTPNMVTTLSIMFGLFAAYAIMRNYMTLAALLTLIAYYFDCVDGKLARQYNMISEFGDLYDHFGDLFKIVIITYALFKSNKKKTSNRQWTYVGLLVLLCLLQFIHMGYQECVYDKENESKFLNIMRKVVSSDNNPQSTIQITKHFGCGTWYLCFAVLIIFWRK